jgi:hypothetical protein
MVRALLAGTKTQTRRVVKWPDWIVPEDYDKAAWELRNCYSVALMQDGRPVKRFSVPYGEPGDRLWVRETFRVVGGHPGKKAHFSDEFQYRADEDQSYVDRYIPSIHMPRCASRIKLEVTGVRVQRVQEISGVDARAEGIQIPAPTITPAEFDHDCVVSYRELWESINGPDSWDANPWVWVVEFRRIPPSQDGCANSGGEK